MDLSIRVTDDDTGEIIQVDGSGDTSSNEEIGSTRDADENEFLGNIDRGDLKVPEEEADSISNEDSATNSSDNEDPQVNIVEEVRMTFELRLPLLIYNISTLLCLGTKRNSKINLFFTLLK